MRELIPPLRDGDRLTGEEFFRRYEADRQVVQAELINGVVHINSRRVLENGREWNEPPITATHGTSLAALVWWMGYYSAHTEGVNGSAPTTIKLSEMTVPEPDATLRIHEDNGGQSYGGPDDYIHGPPELVSEIADTTAWKDLGPKFDAYAADGIREYIVWRTHIKQIDWFELRRKQYVPIEPDADGLLRSRVFPGLWLNPTALVSDRAKRVLRDLERGLASPEHAAFVAKLKKRAARKKK
jgi:Uma2 family endonuclease